MAHQNRAFSNTSTTLITIIMLSILLILSQTSTSYAKTDDSSEVVFFEETEDSTSQENAEPETDEPASESSENSKEKKSKDEAPESAVPESKAMSMASGGSSEGVAGVQYPPPEAVTVSQMGAATFNYPIAVPPGRNGLQPDIYLTYSSYNKNGWVGVGWDLDLGSIKRSTKNGLNYTDNNFVADGSELVDRSGAGDWGFNYYGAKIEGAFTKYYFNRGGNYWIAYAKDGKKFYYGQNPSSRMSNGSKTYSWHLNKVEDTNGNYIMINYTIIHNQLYPHQISYTGKTDGLLPNKIVEFELDERDDDIYSYKTQFLVKTTKRLKTVTVTVDGSPVYKYSLNYENSGSNGRSRLTQIRRVAPNAEEPYDETNSLPPYDFTYYDGGDGTFGTVTTIPVNGPTGGGGELVLGDINGDGIKDFIKAYAPQAVGSSGSVVTVYTYFADGEGGFSYKSTKTLEKCPTVYEGYWKNLMSVSLGDVNGDGKADIMSNGLNGQVHVYLSNGNGNFSSKKTTTGNPNCRDNVFLADLNADGKSDLVKCHSLGYIYTAISKGDGYFLTQVADQVGGTGDSWGTSIQLADFNGDVKLDILSCDSFSGPGDQHGYNIRVFYGDGSGRFDEMYPEVFNMAVPSFADFYLYNLSTFDANGDGLADIAYIDYTGQLKVHLSTGTGMTPWTYEGIEIDPYAMYEFADLDDDGMDDMISNSPDWGFYKSNGDGTFADRKNYDKRPKADLDGDGRNDWIGYDYVTGSSVSYSYANGEDAVDCIESVTNSLGGYTHITYVNSSGLTNNKIPFIVHPVKIVVADDGYNEISQTTYDYSNGYYTYADRDFRGFGNMIQTNPDLSTITTTYEQNDDYKKGRPLIINMKDPGSTLLKKITFTWDAQKIGTTSAFFVKLTNKREDIYGDTNNIYINEAYPSYDNTHGGLKTTIKSGPGAENVIIENAYVNTGSWQWRVASETITGGTTGMARRTYYTYYPNGNLNTKKYDNTSGADPVETYTYDSYGNVKTFKDPKNYTTTYNYDNATNTHVMSIVYPTTGGVTHSVSMDYDPLFGKLDQETDENGNTTYYDYDDDYGRLEQVDYPDGGQKKYTYFDTESPVYVQTSVLESTGVYIDTWQYVDGYGRDIMNVSEGIGNYVVTRQHFDEMGRNNLSEGPYFSSTYEYYHTPPSTYPTVRKSFDYLGRVIGISTPKYMGLQTDFDGTSISYNGYETEIRQYDDIQIPDRLFLRKEIRDYLGRIVKIVEYPGGSVAYIDYEYSYNAVGDLLNFYAPWQGMNIAFVTINYNTLGQKTSMVDADMGSWTYSYDLNGNLATQRDAEYQIITFTHDALNRVTQKSYNTPDDPTVNYSYDNPSITNGSGRLYSVSNGNVITTYNGYDAMGRVLSETKYITDDTYRKTEYTYYLSGKPKKTTYPGNDFWVENEYYPGTNLLYRVTGSDGQIYATIGSYTPSGKIKTLSHGNGSSTTYTYDSRSEKLSQIETKDASLNIIQKKNYYYTSVGEIRGIADNHNNVSYTYAYDNLSGLKTEVVNGMSTSVSINYNAIGYITSKTMNGNTFTYAYSNSSHKHAVSSITFNGQPYSYDYDDNGNMVSGPDFTNPASIKTRSISWNADNMPSEVVLSGGATTVYKYDGMGGRVKKSVGSADTYYIGDHFEIQDGTIVKYIFAGNLRVAQVKGSTRSYFHKDHLGSSTVMTDASGYEIESTEYMPFGSQRNHSGTDTSAYKFTDQELDGGDGESNLYNYNARLYDPIIGMFISADTIVPDWNSPRSFNRYNYCLNNPLVYTDPNGHIPESFMNWFRDRFSGWQMRKTAKEVYAFVFVGNFGFESEKDFLKFLRDNFYGTSDELISQYDSIRSMMNQNPGLPDCATSWQIKLLEELRDESGDLMFANLNEEDPVSKDSLGYEVGKYSVIAFSFIAGGIETKGTGKIAGEFHHIASNKAKISGFKKAFEEIFAKAGMTLDDPANIVYLEGHRGGHTLKYKQYVFNYFMTLTEGLSGKGYKKALVGALSDVKTQLLHNPRMPYRGGL